MHALVRYPVLRTLFKEFHAYQQATVGLVISAIFEARQARTFDIAGRLVSWLRIKFKSALNRIYRLLANPRLEELEITAGLLQLLSARLGRRLLVAVDWTEWKYELRMLVASVICDRRAIPVYTAAFHKSNIPRSQNTRENTFLLMLRRALQAAGCRAVVLCDRGFRRASWLRQLLEQGQDFVVRLVDDVSVGGPRLERRRLSDLNLQPGQVMDLGWVWLRSDQLVQVRVIGVWQPNMDEPWWPT